MTSPQASSAWKMNSSSEILPQGVEPVGLGSLLPKRDEEALGVVEEHPCPQEPAETVQAEEPVEGAGVLIRSGVGAGDDVHEADSAVGRWLVELRPARRDGLRESKQNAAPSDRRSGISRRTEPLSAPCRART